MDDILLEISAHIKEHLQLQKQQGIRFILPLSDEPQEMVTTHEHTTASSKLDCSGQTKSKSDSVSVAQAMRSFAKSIADCPRCDELVNNRSNVVFGEGSPKAKLMFVGEAPGADEDQQGRPFVGKAGQLLDKMLRSVGLDRSDVYIANIIKCRPPGNRNPHAEEIQNCIEYLYRQIDMIQPTVICALGNVAAQTLLETSTGISRMRGRKHSFKGYTLIPTYHPSYLLRSPQMKREAWHDMRFIKQTISEL